MDRSPRSGGSGHSKCQSSARDAGLKADAGPSGWSEGTKVILHGLKSATASPWNGLVAVVHCFDASSQRYVVALPDGTPRMIKDRNLKAADGSGPPPQDSQGGSDSQ